MYASGSKLVVADTSLIVNRGLVDTADFILADFTANSSWNDFDLSSLIPIGTNFVQFEIEIQASITQKFFKLREIGGTTDVQGHRMMTQQINVEQSDRIWIGVNGDRKLEYYATTSGWTKIQVTVVAWLINS